MNFKLNSIVLALAFASSALVDGVAAASQQQLRGSLDNNNNSPQRNMAISCPKVAPTNGSSCANVLSGGSNRGYCGWQHSSWDGTGARTTTIDNCTCNADGNSSWSCTKDIQTITSPPTPSPPPAPAPAPTPSSGSSWCPNVLRGGDICTLPDGKSSGSCTNMSTTNNVTTKNVCTCTSASPTFVCTQTVSN
jgi:hypothetical protein